MRVSDLCLPLCLTMAELNRLSDGTCTSIHGGFRYIASHIVIVILMPALFQEESFHCMTP